MNRITNQMLAAAHKDWFESTKQKSDYVQLYIKLAEYENTGLEPSEVRDLQKRMADAQNTHIKIQHNYHEYTISEICNLIDELQAENHTLKKELDNFRIDSVYLGSYEPGTIHHGVVIGGIYRHFKGHKIKVINIAQHTETSELFVVYICCSDNKIYARPLDMFMSEVDHIRYPCATQKMRFELIE